tara:strand:+ start:1086 stop:1547 length:462 start_codon:yes stop_codon:yes gene_type:complete
MKELILLRGVSGAGKTTVAEIFNWLGSDKECGDGYPYSTDGLAFSNDAVTYSADDYFIDSVTGEYKFDPTLLTDAHKLCQSSVEGAMKEEMEHIVVHNTFTTEWEMQPYFDLALYYGYRVSTLIVENRHESKSIHNVPDEVIEKQRKRFNIKL